jgi:hypothetical protein
MYSWMANIKRWKIFMNIVNYLFYLMITVSRSRLIKTQNDVLNNIIHEIECFFDFFPNENYTSDRAWNKILYYDYCSLKVNCLDPFSFLSFIIIFSLYFKKSSNSSKDVTFDQSVMFNSSFFTMIWLRGNALFTINIMKNEYFTFAFLYANFS